MDKNGYKHLFNAFPMILKWVEKYEHLHFLGIYIYIFLFNDRNKNQKYVNAMH